jgi:hypothetical protein
MLKIKNIKNIYFNIFELNKYIKIIYFLKNLFLKSVFQNNFKIKNNFKKLHNTITVT